MMCKQYLLGLLSLLATFMAFSQSADVGLVSQVKGAVSYTGQGGSAGKVEDYMRVREADRFVLPAGAMLRVVYLQSGRQETWTGPCSLKLGATAGEVLSGKPPQVSQLPPAVPQRIVGAPDMFRQAHMARLGGISVRGGPARGRTLSADDQAAIAAARVNYQSMRVAQSADDITAQVYFAAVLGEYLQYAEMAGVVEEMRRLQPDNTDAQALANWVAERLNRPK